MADEQLDKQITKSRKGQVSHCLLVQCCETKAGRSNLCSFPPLPLICFSLDQLLLSTLDQQKLQSVLSSITTKCDVSSLLKEAKAQAQVSQGKISMKIKNGKYS